MKVKHKLIILLTICVLLLTSCAKKNSLEEAERIAQQLAVTWQADQYSLAYDLFTPELKSLRNKADFTIFAKSINRETKFNLIFDKVVLQSEYEAYAYFTMSNGLIERKAPAIHLIFDEGSWKIDGFASYFTDECVVETCFDDKLCTKSVCNKETSYLCKHKSIELCCKSKFDCNVNNPYCVENQCLNEDELKESTNLFEAWPDFMLSNDNLQNAIILVSPYANENEVLYAVDFSALINCKLPNINCKNTNPAAEGKIILSTDYEYLENKDNNLIIIGNPCDDKIIFDLLDKETVCSDYMKTGTGYISIKPYKTNYAVFIYGLTYKEMGKATCLLMYYDFHELKGNNIEVWGQGGLDHINKYENCNDLKYNPVSFSSDTPYTPPTKVQTADNVVQQPDNTERELVKNNEYFELGASWCLDGYIVFTATMFAEDGDTCYWKNGDLKFEIKDSTGNNLKTGTMRLTKDRYVCMNSYSSSEIYIGSNVNMASKFKYKYIINDFEIAEGIAYIDDNC